MLPPALYHAHHGAFADDLPFWQRLAAENRGTILALGCGTGRVAAPLAAAGIAVVGLDRDAAMLAFLQRRLAHHAPLPLQLVQADFRALPFADGRFGCVILPCNTYTTIPIAQRSAFLRGVARVTAQGGCFAFSAPNPALVAALPAEAEAEPEDAFHHPEEDAVVQVSTGWQRDGLRWTVQWHYDILKPDGQVARLSVTQSHEIAPLAEESARLRQSGWQIVSQFGDFDGTPPEEDAPYWIVVARRL